MPVTLKRIEVHPYVLLQVGLSALTNHRDPKSLGLAGRAQSAAVRKAILATLPDDRKYVGPRVKLYLLHKTVEQVEKRNAELLSADPLYGQLHDEYQPIPNPDHRVTMDLDSGAFGYFRSAVSAFAENPDVSHDLDLDIEDMQRALDGAKDVPAVLPA